MRNNPTHYLQPIDEIESATGLDFLPELPADRANAIESVRHTDLWGSGGGDDGEQDRDGEVVAGGLVLIASLLPNPAGDESQDEAVTVRNEGTAAVSLEGWRLRDLTGNTWALSGTLDPGDERTFTRNEHSL